MVNSNNINEIEVNESNKSENNEKMEICYICGKEFDMHVEKADGAHYHYDEYPICIYCSKFYAFYQNTFNDVQ